MNLFGREPALVTHLCAVVLSTAVAFGLDLSADQIVALNGVVVAVASVVVRQRVTPWTGPTA